jgi:hypothetical protein
MKTCVFCLGKVVPGLHLTVLLGRSYGSQGDFGTCDHVPSSDCQSCARDDWEHTREVGQCAYPYDYPFLPMCDACQRRRRRFAGGHSYEQGHCRGGAQDATQFTRADRRRVFPTSLPPKPVTIRLPGPPQPLADENWARMQRKRSRRRTDKPPTRRRWPRSRAYRRIVRLETPGLRRRNRGKRFR